ncbi:hypothetical protein Ddc_20554 [Ditylenchus destructor]|nr:hypothetical protein Ddc_20554 [Ditylenchus destructor]
MYKSLVDDAVCIDKKHYRNFAFGAWHGNTLIAFVAILDVESSLKPTFSGLLNSNNVDEYGHAVNLMIRREYRNSGIGTKFALMVIKHYIETHRKGIIAEVACDKFAGEKLAKVYEKYGLRKIGKREYTVAGNSYSNIVLAAKFADLVKWLPSTSAN